MAIGGASDCLPLTGSFTLTGPVRVVGADRVLDTPVTVHDLPAEPLAATDKDRHNSRFQSKSVPEGLTAAPAVTRLCITADK